jgi:hypothetical protein
MAWPSDSLRRRLVRAFAAGSAALAMLTPRGAAAFKEPGHRAIERLAYQQLIDQNHGDVLARLVKAGALRGALPVLPDVKGTDPDRYIGLTAGDLNVGGVWVGSHVPDHAFNRQFQSYGQCFHFNARGEDARTPTLAQTGVPEGLSRDAYLRCMSLMDILLRGILADTTDANARHLGLYSLIHMVTDSFSEAHVAREDEWEILYVKPWRLRTWFSNIAHREGWESFVTDNHHGIFDGRDYDYVTSKCEDLKDDASKLTIDCLSSRAKRAADAVVDLLVLVSAYIDYPDAPPGGAAQLPGFEDDWRAYREKHFKHALEAYSALVPEIERNRATEGLVSRSDLIQETAAESIGLGLAFDLESSTDNVWLEGDMFHGKNSMTADDVGFWDAVTQSLQLRLPFETPDGQRPLAIAWEPGLRIPGDLLQSEFMSLQIGLRARVSYGVSRIGPGVSRHIGEVGFGGLSADLVIKRLWIGVTVPRVVWREDTWGPDGFDWYWTVKTGVAFGSD